jgi:hypothetical protein
MQAHDALRVATTTRADALEPLAVAALGPVAHALATRLLDGTDEALEALRGIVAEGLLIALGAVDALPWVAGVTYLGRDPDAPSLLLPTAVRPAVAVEIFEQAILDRAPRVPRPLAVLLSPRRIVSVVGALPIEREKLRRWLEGDR